MENVQVSAFNKSNNEEYSRFKGASWFETARMMNVYIIGCGGVGSWAAINLARFFPASITLYDDDLVETGNMSGQFFEDVEDYKVNALCDNISRFTNYISPINTYTGKFTTKNIESISRNSVVVIGIDDQNAKKSIIKNGLYYFKNKNIWIIDARLSIDTLQVITMDDRIYGDFYKFEKYEKKFLFDPKDADSTNCSLKQTTFMANMIGSVTGNLYMTICKCLCSDFPVSVPYFVQYSDDYSFKVAYDVDEA